MVYEFKNREYADKREAVIFRKLILILKMLEVYFESIPQYSLQTYIFFDNLFESGQIPIELAIYPTKAPTPNTTINMDMPVNLFDKVTVTSRSLGKLTFSIQNPIKRELDGISRFQRNVQNPGISNHKRVPERLLHQHDVGRLLL